MVARAAFAAAARSVMPALSVVMPRAGGASSNPCAAIEAEAVPLLDRPLSLTMTTEEPINSAQVHSQPNRGPTARGPRHTVKMIKTPDGEVTTQNVVEDAATHTLTVRAQKVTVTTAADGSRTLEFEDGTVDSN